MQYRTCTALYLNIALYTCICYHQSKISIKQHMFSLASLKYAKIIYAHCCAKLALLRSMLKRFTQALPSGHVVLSHLIRLHPEDVTFPLPVEAGDGTGIQPVDLNSASLQEFLACAKTRKAKRKQEPV